MTEYFIPKTEATEELYSIESDIYDLIRKQAKLILQYFGKDEKEDYYSIGVPEALFTILDHYDRNAVNLAIQKYRKR